MTILVTGARGGFAKAFIPKLIASVRDDVVSVVRSNPQQSSEEQCDLSDQSALVNLIRKTRPNLIYHLAGSFDGNFETDVIVNAHSTKWIFDELINSKLETRVVAFGSAAEYGLIPDGGNPVRETQSLKPVSVYGLTKVLQTNISSYYASTQGVDVVVARIFNLAVQGLSQRLFYGRLTSLVESYKRQEIDSMSFGNLESIRDYVDLDNSAAQIFAIANRGLMGEIYNVGSGVPIRMKDLLYSLLDKNNIPRECINTLPSMPRPGLDVPEIYADIQKVSSLLLR